MELNNFDYFGKYKPTTIHYIKMEYDTGILASGEKISDMYYILMMGKKNLDMYINKESEIINNFLKNIILFNALSYYNYALDYSWQVVYFYISSNSNLDLIYANLYTKLSKECTLDTVNSMLNFAKSLAEDDKKDTIDYLKNHINSFFAKSNTEYIRETYNYLKHRGMIYPEGYKNYFDYLSISLGDTKLNKLPSKKISSEYLFNELKEYHNNFINYMDKIINEIIPDGYIESNSATLEEVVKGLDIYSEKIKK